MAMKRRKKPDPTASDSAWLWHCGFQVEPIMYMSPPVTRTKSGLTQEPGTRLSATLKYGRRAPVPKDRLGHFCGVCGWWRYGDWISFIESEHSPPGADPRLPGVTHCEGWVLYRQAAQGENGSLDR